MGAGEDAQGRRLLGPATLRTCPFASLLGQVRVRLGPGGYYRRSGNEGPQTCLPAACGMAQVEAQHGPSSSAQDSRPSRGAKPRRADDVELPQARPHQAGSRGGGEIKAGVPREEPVTQAMTIETRWAPACAMSLFPLWCKGGKHRPRHQAKVTVSVQQDQDQHNGRTEVIVETKTASSPVPLAVRDHL